MQEKDISNFTTQVLKNFIGKEVFVISTIVEVDALNSPIMIGETLDEALTGTTLEDLASDEVKVIHGVLMPAEILPTDKDEKLANFIKTKGKVYLVHAEEAVSGFEGTVTEYDDIDTLVIDLEDDFKQKKTYSFGNISALDIDEYYVIYGYTMGLSLTVKSSEYNDEKFNKAVELAKFLVSK